MVNIFHLLKVQHIAVYILEQSICLKVISVIKHKLFYLLFQNHHSTKKHIFIQPRYIY